MNIFIKSVAGTLIALILQLILSKHGKDISLLLTVSVCCMLGAAAFSCLSPVVQFLDRLNNISGIDSVMFQTVLRTVGIGMLAEFTSLLCADAGNNALGKSIQILAGGLILMISLPIMTQLLDMIEQILQPL